MSFRRVALALRAARSSSPTARASSSNPRRRARLTLLVIGIGLVGEQRLAQPAFIVGDEVRGGAENMGGRAVVALEPDDGGAGKILLEAQDVVHLGAAPAIDRLVVVADTADVLADPAPAAAATYTARYWCPGIRRRGCIGSGGDIPPARRGLVAEDADRVAEQVAEIAGVQRRQPRLVGARRVRGPCRWRKRARRRPASRSGARPLFFQPSIICANWRAGQRLSSMPSAWMICLISRTWSSVSRMVKSDLQADQLGMAAQHLDADGVEGAEPRHALDRPADQLADALLHFARRLVGEGDGEDLARPGAAGARIWAMRVVSTRVLPVPAPASTSTGPSVVSTASRCSGFRPLR